MASKLSSHDLPNFSDGYNSFPGSKTAVKDTEFPYGINVIVSDVGSVMKVPGSSQYGPEIASGKALLGGGILKTSSLNRLIVAAGTAWYYLTSSAKTALTGVTFTDNKRTNFCEAFSKLYGANNTDALAYTSDGSTITSIASNGNVGDWPTFFNQRIYMTNATNADRIYYSNPYALDLSTNPPTLTGFSDANMFNTDLTATPKKNAGFIVLSPGSGVEITRLFKDSQGGTDYLYAYTRSHGVWRIASVATANSDGSIAHTVTQLITDGGCPSGLSVIKVANDQWYWGRDNYYTVGEQATYQNVRRATKSGRIRTEVQSVAIAGQGSVAAGLFSDKVWIAYQSGTYNDRILIYDVILNSWSSPISGINAAWFLVYEESDGTRRFLAGSSNSSDSYVYELNTGTNFNGAAISAEFETKSTDCDRPGLIKRFAFIDVFYGSLYGALTYQVYIDENDPITSTVIVGNSTSKSVGVGSQLIGSFPVGAEYSSDTTFASLEQNNNFRIYCNYEAGKKVSVRFSNENASEQFKINGIKIWFKPGNIAEV